MKLTGVVVAIFMTAGTLHAQGRMPSTDASADVFRAAVDVVGLNVVVTDAHQKYVTGLSADDFLVYEDGVQQDLSFFAATEVPLDLAILLDTSASMSDKLHTVQEAAAGFAATLRSGDRVAIVDIKDTVRVLKGLDDDRSRTDAAIRSTAAGGGTALFNGLYMTLKDLTGARRRATDVRRQAIVVLSDGEDTASLLNFDDVMAEAKQAGVAVYTITLRSPYRARQSGGGGRTFSQADYSMRALAQETGGRAFFPTAIAELSGIYGSIAEELSTLYALGYTSKNTRRDGAFRRVVVRLARPELRTRTRHGYQTARVEAAPATH